MIWKWLFVDPTNKSEIALTLESCHNRNFVFSSSRESCLIIKAPLQAPQTCDDAQQEDPPRQNGKTLIVAILQLRTCGRVEQVHE